MNEDAKNILTQFINTIPKVLYGQEKVLYIIENIKNLDNAQRWVLRQFVNEILCVMLEKEASDIEIGGVATNGFIWMRIFGKKEPINEIPQLSYDETAILILNLLTENQRKQLYFDKNIDFSYNFVYQKRNESVRFRADAYFDLDTIALNMRAIASKLRTLDSLGFHPNVLKALSHLHIKQGLTLITGITGSGKSATLDAIIDDHNQKDPAHVIVVASPVEFVHQSKACIIKHREVGRDVLSFKDGIVQALRQDPDIVVVGEMRDPETIMAALEITDTGHRVYSTLHTSSAVESIDRIIAEVTPTEQERVRNRLADVMVALVSQKLVPSLDGKIVLAKEVLLVTPSVKAAIKNNNTSEIYMMINQGAQAGMTTMEQDLKRLYLARKISLETAMAYANNKARLKEIINSN